MSELDYAGGELKIFAKARNWKSYFRSRIQAHIRGEVLEVGAGLGATTHVFDILPVERWVCLEPDPAMSSQLREELAGSPRYEVITGTIEDLPAARRFDAVIYIDVLEHIENDRAEVARAAARLRPGGALVVLSPAHQWLYTPFDKAIGHYRRYTTGMLRALHPPGLRESRLFYLDSAGLFASLANRLLLRQSMPTENQILTWDRAIVPVSRLADRILGFRFGKTAVAVWTRDGGQA
jgi:SAM-dependent methyltransferase